jgi:hypothetical protein
MFVYVCIMYKLYIVQYMCPCKLLPTLLLLGCEMIVLIYVKKGRNRF